MSSINSSNLDRLTEEEFKILCVLEDRSARSNADIAKILNKAPPQISRNLSSLKKVEWVKQNSKSKYFIHESAPQLIGEKISKDDYYLDLYNFVITRKSRFDHRGPYAALVASFTAFLSAIGLAKSSHAQEATKLDALGISGISTKATTSTIFLPVIIISSVVAASGGIIVGDAYFSEPDVDYVFNPKQLPANLYGTALIINDVYSTDDKSEIIHYKCNNEPIVYGLEYTFDCFTENSLGNKEVVTTTVSIKGPYNSLSVKATDCVSQHYVLSDDVTKIYPYLLDLPNLSSSSLSNYKNTHIKMMDDYYESHDYVSAKEHATIVLRYFSINDAQALSTLGNIMRDEDRNNKPGIQCAVIVHSTPFLANTVWGKISLAEDYHVAGEYEKAIEIITIVIDEFEREENPEIHEINYRNALIIKGNSLLRLSFEETIKFEDAKENYLKANIVDESYDAWFGLGNVNYHQQKCVDALEKYEMARKFAGDTTEIDQAINRAQSCIS